MKTRRSANPWRPAIIAIAAVSASLAHNTLADDSKSPQQILSDAGFDLSFRYRFESVDHENFDKDAGANTLRSRLTWHSQSDSPFKALIELDDVRTIGSDKFNSTANSQSQYPVVADPEGSEVNQASIQYTQGDLKATVGRQRINLDDQRFVGGVGWRQNEQTYDGARFQFQQGALNLDYSYISNVNRIFGPGGSKANLEGDIHLVNSGLKISDTQNLTGFIYSLDFDESASYGLSSRTLGFRYTAKLGGVKVLASLASQVETGDNPVDYQTHFASLELSGKFENTMSWSAGYEILGSDDGKKAFNTPLATLHKFQGFADSYLGTPNDGVRDAHVGLGFKTGPAKISLRYHDFSADEGSEKLGSEWDAVAVYPVTKKIKALAKFADYQAEAHGRDTKKFWLMVQIAI
jgi:hypothetical protein